MWYRDSYGRRGESDAVRSLAFEDVFVYFMGGSNVTISTCYPKVIGRSQKLEERFLIPSPTVAWSFAKLCSYMAKNGLTVF